MTPEQIAALALLNALAQYGQRNGTFGSVSEYAEALRELKNEQNGRSMSERMQKLFDALDILDGQKPTPEPAAPVPEPETILSFDGDLFL